MPETDDKFMLGKITGQLDGIDHSLLKIYEQTRLNAENIGALSEHVRESDTRLTIIETTTRTFKYIFATLISIIGAGISGVLYLFKSAG